MPAFLVTLAEVLGLASTTNTTVGFAGIRSALPFTFDPFNRAVLGEYDAIGAMEHETMVQGGVAQFSPLDLFRYASPGQLSYQLPALAPQDALSGNNVDLAG